MTASKCSVALGGCTSCATRGPHRVPAMALALLLVKVGAVQVQIPRQNRSADDHEGGAELSRLHATFKEDPSSEEMWTGCPPLFAAVTTTPDNLDRRQLIRNMWRRAGVGWGTVHYKFAVCAGKGHANVTEALMAEAASEHDILIMECEEGYLNGILTRKVEAAMKVYLEDFSQRHDLFMKIDDDTFISTRRLCDFLKERRPRGERAGKFYLGVFAEGNENMDTKHVPIRDPTNPWFEPYDKFPDDVYPVSAKGGPGYMLPGNLVRLIIENGIAEGNELNNEDKAFGYWVWKLRTQYGHDDIEYFNVPGTDGYDEHKEWITTSGPYESYSHIMHHHLTGEAIACLHVVDASNDPSRRIDDCFPRAEKESSFAPRRWGATFTPGGPRIHMPF